MKTTKLSLTLGLGLFIVAGQAGLSMAAEPEEAGAAAVETLPAEAPTLTETAKPDEDEDQGAFGSYTAFWDRQLEHIRQLDAFGLTGTQPAGYLYIQGDWNTSDIAGKYDTKRHLNSAVPEVIMDNKAGDTILSADFGLGGSVGYRAVELGYGITDFITAFVRVPYVFMDTSFNPSLRKIDAEGNYVLPGAALNLGISDPKTYNGIDFMNTTLPSLGRQSPAASYRGDWLLGDVSAGFNWNLYRSKCKSFPCLSVSISPEVVFPTAKVQDSDASLMYVTGPAMDAGLGGWAVGSTQALDVRLFKHGIWFDVVASTQFGATYAFEQHRDYPKYGNVSWQDFGDSSLKDWRPFMNISDVTGDFRFTPGWQVDWLAQLQVTSTLLTLTGAYVAKFVQDPEIKADPDFALSVRTWSMVGQGLAESLRLTAKLDLMPLYVPADVTFQYTQMLDGYNTIKYDNYYTVMLKVYIPIFPDA